MNFKFFFLFFLSLAFAKAHKSYEVPKSINFEQKSQKDFEPMKPVDIYWLPSYSAREIRQLELEPEIEIENEEIKPIIEDSDYSINPVNPIDYFENLNSAYSDKRPIKYIEDSNLSDPQMKKNKNKDNHQAVPYFYSKKPEVKIQELSSMKYSTIYKKSSPKSNLASILYKSKSGKKNLNDKKRLYNIVHDNNKTYKYIDEDSEKYEEEDYDKEFYPGPRIKKTNDDNDDKFIKSPVKNSFELLKKAVMNIVSESIIDDIFPHLENILDVLKENSLQSLKILIRDLLELSLVLFDPKKSDKVNDLNFVGIFCKILRRLSPVSYLTDQINSICSR